MILRAGLISLALASLATNAAAEHRHAPPRGPALAKVGPAAEALAAELDALQESLGGIRRDVRGADLDCLVEYLESVRDEVRRLNTELSRRDPHRTRRALREFCEDNNREEGMGGGESGDGAGGGGGGAGGGQPGGAPREPERGVFHSDSVDVRVTGARRVNAGTVFVELSVTNKAERRMLSLSRAALVDAVNGTVYTQTHVSDAQNDVGLSMVGAGETVTGTIAFRVTKGRNDLSLRLQDADGDAVNVSLLVAH